MTTIPITFEFIIASFGSCFSTCSKDVLPDSDMLVKRRLGKTALRQIPRMSANSSAELVMRRSKYEYPLRAPKPAVTLSPRPTNKISFVDQGFEKAFAETAGPAGPFPIGRLNQKCR